MEFTSKSAIYALLAANVYGATNNGAGGKPLVRSGLNTLPLPSSDWVMIAERVLVANGFMARAYREVSTGEVVIAYAGTTSESVMDWPAGNIPAAAGLPSPQVIEAARFYMDVLNSPYGQSGTISFTGHSLGGGLASLMAVYFNHEAIVFDQAPFEKSADSYMAVMAVKVALLAQGYPLPESFAQYVALDPAGGAFLPSPSRLAREHNVDQVFVTGEALSLAGRMSTDVIAQIAARINVSLGILALSMDKIQSTVRELDVEARSGYGWGVEMLPEYEGGNPADLHSISLLAGLLLSGDFFDAVKDHPELLARIFAGQYSKIEPSEEDRSTLLDLLIQRHVAGEQALDVLAADIGKITGAMLSGYAATFMYTQGEKEVPMTLAAALVDAVLAGMYAQGNDRPNDQFVEAFRNFLTEGAGSLRFDSDDLGEQDIKGLSALRAYLNSVSNGGIWKTQELNHARWTIQNSSAGISSAGPNDSRPDVMIGVEGGNMFLGGGGDDILIGGIGNDDLSGEAGSDTLVGGFGADSYRFSSGDSSWSTTDTIIDTWGDGTIYFDGVPVVAGERISAQTWYDSTEKLKLTYISESFGSALIIGVVETGGMIRVMGWSPGELGIVLNGGAPDVTGTSMTNDADLFGPYGANAGNDIVNGLAGNDGIEGGAGNDYLDGGAGDDLILGGAGEDRIYGGDGNDQILDGSELIDMRELRTTLDEDGTSELQRFNADLARLGSSVVARGASWYVYRAEGGAATGDATLDGGRIIFIPRRTNLNPESSPSGDDLIDAGAGSDTVHAGEGNDIIVGGSGNDRLVGGHDNDIINGGDDDDEIDGDLTSDAIAGVDLTALVSAAAVRNGADILDGGGGNDIVRGGGGNDVIHGGAGNDFLQGRGRGHAADPNDPDADYIDGGTGDDQIVGNSGNDTLLGGDGNDTVFGDDDEAATQGGDDFIAGGQGNDILIGQGGNDTIHGEQGADTIQGDSFALDGGDHGDDLISAGTENDTVYGMGGNDVIYGDDGDDVLLGDAEIAQLAEQFHGDDFLYGGAGADVLKGGSGNDALDGGIGDDQLFGENGDDRLQGGTGVDQLVGGNGADHMSGGAGNDKLWGDADGDIMLGGAGADELMGGTGNDMLDGGTDDDKLWGEAGDDILKGASGLDRLSGGDGNDTLDGGDENDVIYGDAGNDQLMGGDGVDTLHGGNGSDLVDGGSGDDTIYGDSGTESGNDTLRGGTGNDRIYGGDGSDVFLYSRGDGSDRIYESHDADNSDVDTVRLGPGILPQHVTLYRARYDVLGDDDLVIVVDGSNQQIWISSYFSVDGNTIERIEFDNGNGPIWTETDIQNMLQPPGTRNSMAGTGGNDIFVVDHESDVVVEQANGGIDLIESSRSFTISPNVENITLTGALNINATGNALNNIITGNSGDNAIDGGNGRDIAYGGAGDDTYVNVEQVFENAGEGMDTLFASDQEVVLSANVENLVISKLPMLGSGGYYYKGNSSSNTIQVDARYGYSCTIDGGAGADIMSYKGSGNVTFKVDDVGDQVVFLGTQSSAAPASGQVISVASTLGGTYRLASMINNYSTTSTQSVSIAGNDLDNRLSATRAAAGSSISGGLGDDVYILSTGIQLESSQGVQFIEKPDEGFDTIYVSSGESPPTPENIFVLPGNSFVIPENFEAVNLGYYQGEANLGGNSSANLMVGNSWDNIIDGGSGADTMRGLQGADTYYVDSIGDMVVEENYLDKDKVISSVDYILPSNVEDLVLAGAAVLGEGNELDNHLVGNELGNFLSGGSGSDNLEGMDGNDRIDGGTGDDTLSGGGGSDTYVFGRGYGSDSIDNHDEGIGRYDVIHMKQGISLSDILLVRMANNLVVKIAGTSDQITINDFYLDDAYRIDAIQLFDGTIIAGQDMDIPVNNPPAVGVALPPQEMVEGVSFSLTLPQDLFVDDPGETLELSFDMVPSWLFYDRLARLLWGTPPNGASSGTISIIGTDGVGQSATTTLSYAVLNAVLGTANVDSLTGTSGRDALFAYAGNDSLNGGAGADRMHGGMGDDTYIVDNAGDVVIEAIGEGDDLVNSAVSYSLPQEVERLTLTGTSASSGTGNASANLLTGNSAGNTLSGLGGNDILDGKGGADILKGGAGDDTYVVDNTGDVVTELAGEGIDTVNASVTHTLSANVENLTHTGSGAINGTGNEAANILTGNSGKNELSGLAGADILDGKAGADKLTGGMGNDTYAMARTYGIDTVVENDATAGNVDIARFLTGVTYDQLWFRRPTSSNNLEISIIGTADKLVLKDWYLGDRYRVEEIRVDDGAKVLHAADVQALVIAMAALTMPGQGQTTLNSTQRQALSSTFSANWQDQTQGGQMSFMEIQNSLSVMDAIEKSGSRSAIPKVFNAIDMRRTREGAGYAPIWLDEINGIWPFEARHGKPLSSWPIGSRTTARMDSLEVLRSDMDGYSGSFNPAVRDNLTDCQRLIQMMAIGSGSASCYADNICADPLRPIELFAL